MSKKNEYTAVRLPFGLQVNADGRGGAALKGSLYEQFRDEGDDQSEALSAKAASDAMEALILAMAAAGIDLSTQAFAGAIKVAVAAVADRLDNPSPLVASPSSWHDGLTG